MLMRCASARTRYAFGRFAWSFACVAVVGCTTVGTVAPDREPAPAAPAAPPVVEPGPVSGLEQAQAAEMFDSATVAFETERAARALELANRIVDELPGSAVSGAALWLSARAALELGDGAAADSAAAEYLALPGADLASDPGPAAVRLLQAEATAGRPVAALERLLRIGGDAGAEELDDARALAREIVEALPEAELSRVIEAAPPGAPVRGVLEARHAALVLERGDTLRATTLARAALDAGASGPDAELATGVLRGQLPPGFTSTTAIEIAVVLPLGGPPALAAFAALVLEGVEVAAATALGPRYEVGVVARDDEGDPDRTTALVRELEQDGVQGIVGFLQDLDLEAAVRGRAGGVPLISPTARTLTGTEASVYTIEGVDAQGLRDLARYAASSGYQRVAVIRPGTELAGEEARVFADAAAELGVPTVTSQMYVEGATFFEPQIMAARDALRAAEIRALGLTEDDTLRVEELDPVALFLPVPPEDVELLAPQIVHFGLDTLGIDVLGTSGWTDPQMLARVDTRHTDGVVATAPVQAGPGTAAYQRFKEAYERDFQRTLVSEVPAFGYDAALVLLEALRSGRSSADALSQALDAIGEVEGATGLFSVRDGRVYRRTEVVLVRSGASTPVPIG